MKLGLAGMGRKGGLSPISLLFEMNTLFEEYIGRTLRRALAGRGIDVRLQGPEGHALVEDDAIMCRFKTLPDIVLTPETMPAVVTELRPLGAFATWQAERAVGITIAIRFGCVLIRKAMRAGLSPA